MKRKILSVVLAAVLAFGLVACGNSNSGTTDSNTAGSSAGSGTEDDSTGVDGKEDSGDTDVADTEGSTAQGGFALDGTWPEEVVKIGVILYDVTDEQGLNVQKYYEDMTNYFNMEFMYSESIASAEDELKFIENCAAAGCKAVIGYYNVTEAEAVQLCADKGMYYWGGSDKTSIYEAMGNNEYYVGSPDNGDADIATGYDMAKALIAQGAKEIVYVSGGDEMGIEMFIKRYEGFKKAVDEADGVEIIRKVPGWPGTDAFTAEQTAVCDMEFDALASSFSAAVWFQPLASAGRLDGSLRIATIGNVSDVFYDTMNEGTVSVIIYECEEIIFGNAIPMILNAVSGHMEANRNAEGTAANYTTTRWTIDSADYYNTIYDKHENNEWFITAEDIANCLVEYNPDANYDTLVNTYSSLDIDSAMN